MIAYLLAAGYATRLWPLTRDCAKPLLEVGGAPILTHLVRGLEAIEALDEIVVVTNARFAPDLVAWSQALACRVPVRVLNDGTRREEDKLGAIGDLRFAVDEVPPRGRDWIVAAGDNLIRFDLGRFAERMKESGDPVLVLRRIERMVRPSPYNEVTVDGKGFVTRFREKPADPQSNLAATALYFFPARVAPLVEEYLAGGGNEDAPGHFVAWLVDRMPVRGERFEGEWFDIGSHETLAEARRRLA